MTFATCFSRALEQDGLTHIHRLEPWEELESRGLLESTTILWLGEFGRTPRINAQAGRDHFPAAWSCCFAGGGVAGGQAYGRTSEDGMDVVREFLRQSHQFSCLAGESCSLLKQLDLAFLKCAHCTHTGSQCEL